MRKELHEWRPHDTEDREVRGTVERLDAAPLRLAYAREYRARIADRSFHHFLDRRLPVRFGPCSSALLDEGLDIEALLLRSTRALRESGRTHDCSTRADEYVAPRNGS